MGFFDRLRGRGKAPEAPARPMRSIRRPPVDVPDGSMVEPEDMPMTIPPPVAPQISPPEPKPPVNSPLNFQPAVNAWQEPVRENAQDEEWPVPPPVTHDVERQIPVRPSPQEGASMPAKDEDEYDDEMDEEGEGEEIGDDGLDFTDRVAPARPPLVRQPQTPAPPLGSVEVPRKPGRPPKNRGFLNVEEDEEGVQYLPRRDLKAFVLEQYDDGKPPSEIFEALKKKKWKCDETNDYISLFYIRGLKSEHRREVIERGAAEGELSDGDPDTLPAYPARIPGKKGGKDIVIPPPRTKLDVFIEMLRDGLEAGNQGIVEMAAQGIYAQMEGGEGKTSDTRYMNLLEKMITDTVGQKNPIDDVVKIAGLLKTLMPEPPGSDEDTEAVGIARAVGETLGKVSEDISSTIRDVTGSKGKADAMAKCPKCENMIPKDSLFCRFCGLSFQTIEGEQDAEELPVGEGASQEQLRAKRAAVKIMEGKKRKALPPAQMPEEGVEREAPPGGVAPGGDALTDMERKSLLRNVQRLANFIAAGDDPVKKTEAMFMVGDENDKKDALFLAIVGQERVTKAAVRYLEAHPEYVEEYGQYVDICMSQQGMAWIDASLGHVINLAQQMNIQMTREEAAAKLAEFERRLGFEVR